MATHIREKPNAVSRADGVMLVVGIFLMALGAVLVATVALAAAGVVVFAVGATWALVAYILGWAAVKTPKA